MVMALSGGCHSGSKGYLYNTINTNKHKHKKEKRKKEDIQAI
jgi:hypothetical protein